MKYTAIFFLLLINSSITKAVDCPYNHGQYSGNRGYQELSCRYQITADTKSGATRRFLFKDDGKIEIIADTGGTKSGSTGGRVYYILPLRIEKKIISTDNNSLKMALPSGVRMSFDESGRMSSSDLKMNISDEISLRNKSGVEIESYPNGLVIDLGFKVGGTVSMDKNATAVITDKNKKKCSVPNSELNKIGSDAVFIYKTNESFHSFLSKKCPNLDISDLSSPQIEKYKIAKAVVVDPIVKDKLPEDLEALKTPSDLGAAPLIVDDLSKKDNAREEVPKKDDDLDSLIQSLNAEGNSQNK